MSAQPSPVQRYFMNIWSGISTTAVGMRLTLKYFFRKPVTMRYPEEKPVIPAGHRGLHGFDEDRCAVCRSCARACPVDCIYIDAVGKGKNQMLTQFDVDYTKCLFCDLCTLACPTECIWMTENYDLSGYTRDDCVIHFAKPKSEQEIEDHLDMIARLEAEKKAKAEAAKKKKEEEAKQNEE